MQMKCICCLCILTYVNEGQYLLWNVSYWERKVPNAGIKKDIPSPYSDILSTPGSEVFTKYH